MFIMLLIITILLRLELTNDIIKLYKDNPNRSIQWIAQKAETTDKIVANTIANLERKEWDPIKFKIKRSKEMLEANSDILENIFNR